MNLRETLNEHPEACVVARVALVANGVYLAASEADSGKSAVALGLYEHALRRGLRVAAFRPVVRAGGVADPLIELLRSRGGPELPFDSQVGVTYDDMHADPDDALSEIIARYRALASQVDATLVVGTDFSEVGAPVELTFNARVAVNLGIPILFVASGKRHVAEDILSAVEIARTTFAEEHAELLRVVVNRVDPTELDRVRASMATVAVPVDLVPESSRLTAPSVGELAKAVSARLFSGDAELLNRDALDVMVGAMTLPNALGHLTDGCLVVTPGDRSDMLVGMMLAHWAESYPPLAGIILTGGFEPTDAIGRLVEGATSRLPVFVTDLDTFDTAASISATKGRITAASDRKIEAAVDIVAEHIDLEAVVSGVGGSTTPVTTPLVFEYDLIDRARKDRRRVVLPEGTEPRVLRAAEIVLRRGIADITLLGNASEIAARATDLGLDISSAQVLDPNDSPERDRFAKEYAALRAHKGMTLDGALDIVADVSYFGTMMVHTGRADGMVSGAVHTTAHTIRPSFEIIKTKPGVSIVSSVFLMALADRVLVYGDCAVNPNPDATQLADIAISSAETAAQFGVAPRVAMLSYSTGSSGSGADVEKVRTATDLVRERRPDLSVEGPIQYDAAVDAGVAKTKLPDSDVAGRATVFIFPDLNTGNNTYKAVQRSAGAVAIGPVLQGLNKPVNDLSRGALVEDIVNTVAITAIQAQNPGAPT